MLVARFPLDFSRFVAGLFAGFKQLEEEFSGQRPENRTPLASGTPNKRANISAQTHWPASNRGRV